MQICTWICWCYICWIRLQNKSPYLRDLTLLHLVWVINKQKQIYCQIDITYLNIYDMLSMIKCEEKKNFQNRHMSMCNDKHTIILYSLVFFIFMCYRLWQLATTIVFFCVFLVYVFTFCIPCCGVCYDFRIKTMLDSPLPLIVCRRAHVLFTLFVFVCT